MCIIFYFIKVHGGLGNPVFSHKGSLNQDWHLAKIYLDPEYTTSPINVSP